MTLPKYKLSVGVNHLTIADTDLLVEALQDAGWQHHDEYGHAKPVLIFRCDEYDEVELLFIADQYMDASFVVEPGDE